MHSPLCVFLVKITTAQFLEFGFGEVKNLPSHCLLTGQLITKPTPGKSWTPSLQRPRKWLRIICPGREPTRKEESLTRAKFSSKLKLNHLPIWMHFRRNDDSIICFELIIRNEIHDLITLLVCQIH